ncbi:MAG: beta strand repeat-containing protein [Thiohalospira sp.]
MDTLIGTSGRISIQKNKKIRRMKKAFWYKSLAFMAILFLALGLQNTFGQGVGISESSITPHESSILELRSSERGFLIPRMTEVQRDAIATPATGLIIYNTSTDKLNIYDGTTWRVLFSGDVGINDIFGTVNRIAIDKSDVANPIIDIDNNYIGQTSITTLGTITTGTWNADILDVQYGGTGLSTFGGTNTVLYTSSADNLEAVPTSTADGQFLQTTTAGSAPTWKTILDVSNGGTGLTSIIENNLIYGNDAGAVNLLAPDGTTGTLLMNTDGGAPSWSTLDALPATAGILNTVNGGTGQSTYTDGQLLIGNSAGSLTRTTITGTANRVIVTNGDGSITLSTPQDIHTGASPEFVGLTLSGLTADQGVYTTTGGFLTTTPPSSGTLGYWDRDETLGVLSPSNAGDDITTTGNLNADGQVDLAATAVSTNVHGILNVAEQAIFTGNVDATSGLDVTGANLTVGSTTIDPTNGNTSVAGTLGVTEATTLSDALTVSGTTTLDGTNGLQFDAGQNVTEISTDVTLADSLDTSLPTEAAVKGYVDNEVTGITLTSGSGVTVDTDNTIDLGGTLDQATTITQADNAFTIDNSGTSNTTVDLTSTGDFVVADDGSAVLTVTDGGQVTSSGNIDATSGLDVTGANLTVGSTTIDPTNGNTSVAGTLGVTEATTLSSTLDAGATTVTDLIATGNVTLGNEAADVVTVTGIVQGLTTNNDIVFKESNNNLTLAAEDQATAAATATIPDLGGVNGNIVVDNASQTLTNKTLTSPTLTTPDIGAATASSINNVTITDPGTGATLTIADGKTLTASDDADVSGTNRGDVTLAGKDYLTISDQEITANNIDLTDDVSGTLPIANGGTGQNSYTDGELLIGNSADNTLNKTTLTAGNGINITNGNGSITISNEIPIQQISEVSTYSTQTFNSYELIPGMTVTPAAGDYLIFFTCSSENDTGGAEYNKFAVYRNGSIVSESEVIHQPTNDEEVVPVSITTLLTGLTGSETIEIRVRTTNNSEATLWNTRSLIIQRVK